MTTIPNIKLTETEYENLTKRGQFDCGGESIILQSNRPDTLYKIFTDYGTTTPTGLGNNKYQKIQKLFQDKLDHIVQPLSTISLNGELIGYEMTYDENDIPLGDINLSRKQTIEVLKRSADILKYFASRDIIHGDVKANNILVNKKTKTIKFCDVDNMQIGEYPIDLINDYIDSIILVPADITKDVDAYMHNLMTLKLLTAPNLTYDEILYNLSEGKYRRSYKQEAHASLATMASPEPFIGEYIVQYIKR